MLGLCGRMSFMKNFQRCKIVRPSDVATLGNAAEEECRERRRERERERRVYAKLPHRLLCKPATQAPAKKLSRIKLDVAVVGVLLFPAEWERLFLFIRAPTGIASVCDQRLQREGAKSKASTCRPLLDSARGFDGRDFCRASRERCSRR